jgi:hypothetical protein
MASCTVESREPNSAITTPSAPVPVDQRIAQYVQILATANDNAAHVVVSLKDSGILSADKAAQIAVYQVAIAKSTSICPVRLYPPRECTRLAYFSFLGNSTCGARQPTARASRPLPRCAAPGSHQ